MKLVLPTVEETKNSFLEHIKPFCFDKKELDKVFCFFNGIALKLGEKLEQENALSPTSYLYEQWLQSYLSGEQSLSLSTNFSLKLYIELELELFIKALAQLCFKYQYSNLEPFFDSKGTQFSLHQFQILKGACRIARKNLSQYQLSSIQSNFCTVFYKNTLYKLELFDEKGCFDLKEAFDEILNQKTYQKTSLSTLSFAHLTKASELRTRYKDANIFFDLLENALFNVSIIDEDFKNYAEEIKGVHFLRAENSWLFKPLNFIYNLKNKNFYGNFEHSFEDGGTIVNIIERSMDSFQETKAHKKAKALIVHEYTDKLYQKEASFIKKTYLNQIKFYEALYLEYECKNHLNLSTDFIFQAALAYASYKTHKKFLGQYEAVDMRTYDFGRTECLRALSFELCEAIKNLKNENAKILLQKANEKHKSLIKACKNAKGIDRHLFGLKNMILKLQTKEQKLALDFFNSKAYKTVSRNFICTSSLGYGKYHNLFFFTPTDKKGIGVSYAKKDEKFYFLISYFKKDEQRLQIYQKHLKEFFERLSQI